MAKISLSRIMDRVSLVFDCDTTEEADSVYDTLISQVLDNEGLHIRINKGISMAIAVEEPCPSCKSSLKIAAGGGVRCDNCGWWFCF